MIAENLIFKTTLMLSAVIHLAGFGLFLGNGPSSFKNGPVPNDTSVAIYEIGFVQRDSSGENKCINQSLVCSDGEELYEMSQNAESVSKIEGTSGLAEQASGGLKDKYLLEVRKRIEAVKFYPKSARERQLNGNIILSFFINEDGTVKDVKIIASSGYYILDIAGKDAVLKANPFPAPPKVELGNIQITLIYRCNF